MHKDSENSGNYPFQEKIDLENFFMDGGRAEVLARLQESIDVGVPLLVMTGEEGSGKTMLCRMLEQRVTQECVVVYFKHTVESFEDVVRVIASELGVVTAAIVDGEGVKDAIEQIVAFLLESRRHLLIIFDEAEIIYLATLERIRKMLDQMTEEGVYLHILFSGRPSFLENYEQLIICDFREIEEVHLRLKPLSEGETADYLEGCINRLSDSVERDVFTQEVILTICAIAKGNFGKVNSLAEESILTTGDSSSFMVLLDSVADEREKKDEGLEWLQAMTYIKRFIPPISWVGGAAAVIFVLLLIFWSGDEEQRQTVVPPKKVNEQEQEIVIGKKEIAKPEPVVEEKVQIVEKEVNDAVVTPEVVFVEVGEGPVIAPVSQPEIIPVETARQEQETAQQETGQLETIKVETEQQENVQPEIEQQAVETQGDTVAEREKVGEIPLPKEDVIVELRPPLTLKKKVGVLMPSKKSKLLVKTNSEVSKTTPVEAHLTVTQLYARRIAAGKEWERGARNSMYTIQLMVLTSKNGEENLKKMLAQENYRRQATNFFILKKNGSPAILMVYYGEYPTIAEARRVKQSMPSFLQIHRPYAMSIKGAVDKASN